MTAVNAAATLHPQCDWVKLRLVNAHDARNIIREYPESIGWLRPMLHGKGVRKGNERHDLFKWLIATIFNVPGHVLEELKLSDDERENMLKPFVIVNVVGAVTADLSTIVIKGHGMTVTMQ